MAFRDGHLIVILYLELRFKCFSHFNISEINKPVTVTETRHPPQYSCHCFYHTSKSTKLVSMVWKKIPETKANHSFKNILELKA